MGGQHTHAHALSRTHSLPFQHTGMKYEHENVDVTIVVGSNTKVIELCEGQIGFSIVLSLPVDEQTK